MSDTFILVVDIVAVVKLILAFIKRMLSYSKLHLILSIRRPL